MKHLLYWIFLFGCWHTGSAQQTGRIELNNIEVLSNKKEFLLLRMDLINTGSTDIVVTNNLDCSVEFIEKLPPTLEPYQKNIELAVLNAKLILSAGSSKSWTLKVSKQNAIAPQQTREAPTYKVNLENCADLLLSDCKIVKETSNYLWIEYTIVNRGKKTANLYGEDLGKNSDNVTLKSVLSSSAEISTVFWESGSVYIDKGMKLRGGLLNPQESYTDLIKVDLSGQTKFTSYIILQLDPYLVIEDCNRANNNLTIKFK